MQSSKKHAPRTKLLTRCGWLLGLGIATGCGFTMGGEDHETRPAVLALSRDALAIGDSLEVYGGNFFNNQNEHTTLRFKGTFTPQSGAPVAVDLRVRPHWIDGNHLVWSQVGPFSNPFSQTNEIGTFSGQVLAINVDGTGGETSSDPLPATLAFTESIVIRAFHPLRANCAEPVKRILGGFPYQIEIEAVGFKPVNFTYAIAGEPYFNQPRVYRRPAQGQSDTFGANGELIFAPVPNDVVFQLVNLSVAALGEDGRERVNSLVFGVHRPIEYVDSGTFKIAEVMPAMPDSGCLSGGHTGRIVTYTESHTDTREREVGIEWGEAWNQSATAQHTLSNAVTQGISITKNGSSTESSTYGWNWEVGAHVNVGVEAGAKGGIPGFGEVSGKVMTEVGVEAHYGKNGSHTTAYSRGWAVGRDYSSTDTESWAFSQTRGYTVSKGGHDFWKVSSSDSKSLAFTGDVLPGQFGVFYRQAVRVALPGALVAYNLCGNPSVVGTTNFFDYSWSVDLAVGNTCSPFPASTLPEPKCNVTPCAGE